MNIQSLFVANWWWFKIKLSGEKVLVKLKDSHIEILVLKLEMNYYSDDCKCVNQM